MEELGPQFESTLTDAGIEALWEAHPKAEDDDQSISWDLFQGPKGQRPRFAGQSQSMSRDDMLAQRETLRAEEIAGVNHNVFGRFDLNGDNSLTLEEYTASLSARRESSNIDFLFSLEDEDQDGLISFVS